MAADHQRRASELQMISREYPRTTSPCIDEGVFGPTVADGCWSATTYASGFAWYVYFNAGDVYGFGKHLTRLVRPGRAGL
jgi:hypothetical protein